MHSFIKFLSGELILSGFTVHDKKFCRNAAWVFEFFFLGLLKGYVLGWCCLVANVESVNV